MNFFTKTLLLCFLSTLVVLTLEDNGRLSGKSSDFQAGNLARSRRGFFFKKKKPGPFGTIIGLMFDQWRDTKQTVDKVRDTLNAQFADENEIKPQKQIDENSTTTEEPYKLTRSELYQIIRRNVRGLQRLFWIELEDALNQPKMSYKDVRHHPRNPK